MNKICYCIFQGTTGSQNNWLWLCCNSWVDSPVLQNVLKKAQTALGRGILPTPIHEALRDYDSNILIDNTPQPVYDASSLWFILMVWGKLGINTSDFIDGLVQLSLMKKLYCFDSASGFFSTERCESSLLEFSGKILVQVVCACGVLGGMLLYRSFGLGENIKLDL